LETEYTAFNDDRLQYFKNKSQIKGETTFEKLSNLIQRWEKVIEDCEKSSDKTGYRIQFREAHRLPLSAVKMHLKDLDPLDNLAVKELVKNLKQRALFYLEKTIDGTGASDALYFVVAELDNCI
jgi:alanyl-tRNA synthetase